MHRPGAPARPVQPDVDGHLSYNRRGPARYPWAIVSNATSVKGPSGLFFYSSLAAALIGFGLFFDHVSPPAKETLVSQSSKDERAKAQHGLPSEVSWNGGAGRQPYANQGPEEAAQTGGAEFSEGNRGELSGRNREQLDQVRSKP